MTIAALLLALIATPGNDAAGAAGAEPILLDFHASWCGPCQQMRPAVEQLVRKGYPVKSIDIDKSPRTAERYNVTSVPTFIVIDADGRTLARTKGAQPAAELARLYNGVKTKAEASPRPADEPPAAAADDDEQADEAAEPPAQDERPAAANPKPWETCVRIKVQSNGMLGFGSGTIIHSTPKESIILTCAHIFKVEGRRQYRPSEFPNTVSVDLFDGQLHGTNPAQVHYAKETYTAQVIDYDFNRDVGLILIRPGRRLKASRVVPAHWEPKARMQLITVGCSEGHDATAWSTQIVNPAMHGLQGNGVYEAIECWNAPKQGRSGGGLYTSDGYLAGVCDFAEPRGNHGLYAAPRSIYHILDRNKLMALYAPVDRARGGALLAERGPKPRPRRGASAGYARAQSPDHEEGEEVVTIPPPELLGIRAPKVAGASSKRSTARKSPWHAAPGSVARVSDRGPATEEDRAEATDLKLPPSVDSDPFSELNEGEHERGAAEADDEAEPSPDAKPARPSKWRPVHGSGTVPRAD